MTSGRLALGPVTERFGVGRAVSFYISLSLAFQFLLKFVSSATFSLGLLGIIGFFLGPMYPSGIILLAEKISSQTKINAVAAVGAIGQVGGALAPLAIGLAADSFGIGRMLDIILSLTIFLLLVWFFYRRLPYYDGTHHPDLPPLQQAE